MLAYVKHHVPEARKVPLCGNSIATDRWFIARDMPELDALLHYRMIDVSSVKELARRWYPRAYFASPAKHGGHRALADITESVQELRYYREARIRAAARAGLRDRAGDRRAVRERAAQAESAESAAAAVVLSEERVVGAAEPYSFARSVRERTRVSRLPATWWV